MTFRTDSKVAAAVLPRPLRPVGGPLAAGFAAPYPATDFGVTYHDGALFVAVAHWGEHCWYCQSIPVDDDTAMIGGREQFGFVKNIADRITRSLEPCMTRAGSSRHKCLCGPRRPRRPRRGTAASARRRSDMAA